MAKVEAHRVPGLGAFIRSFGSFPVRRGESDREAVRTMREIVARRARARPLRRGHAAADAASRARCSPGAAMVALQEDVPVVPAAIHGTQYWKPGTCQPVSVAWGEPMRFDGLPKGGKGYKEASAMLQAEIRGSATGSSRCTSSAGRTAPPAPTAHERRRRRREDGRGGPEIAGTVAIVGFPNVGKSTLVNRLTETRAAVVHETPGVTRDRKELLCEWNGKHVPPRRHGRRRRAPTPARSAATIAEQARAAIDEADLVLFVVDARAGITPGRRGARGDPARRRASP